jgi:glycosyltransferase involved in cell wall biosynthesis
VSAPSVSVLITAYNYGRFIGRAIESALAQDYPADALEVIVVDDGSTDDTPTAVAPYLDRIRYIRQENGGVVAATNRALEAATGDYLAMLCADDTWPQGRVRAHVDALETRPELGLVYSDLEMIDEHDELLHPSYFGRSRILPRSGHLFGTQIESCTVPGGASTIRATLRERFFPLAPEAPFEDWWITAHVARHAEIAFVPGISARYRQHGANICLDADGEQLARQLWRETWFRRHLVASVRPGEATRDELVAAWRKLEWAAQWSATELALPVTDALPVSPNERARAAAEALAARRLLGRGRIDAAVFAFVRSLTLDPWSPSVREELGQALALPAFPEELGARSFATVALADELVSEPDLLAAYCAAFSGDDDATLVVLAPGWSDADLARKLGPLVAGVDADLLAVAADGSRLAGTVDALLSRTAPTGALAMLPRVDERGLAALRAAALPQLLAA